MADREPRRRKKRKDSVKKVHFSDDHQSDEASTLSFQKLEQRDSDQDVEDELPPPPSHQPSQVAQIVFMIFFLALAGLMASVFIALHGSNSHLQRFNGEEESHIEMQPLPDADSDMHEEEEEHHDEPLTDLLEKFQELTRDFRGDTTKKVPDESEEEEIVSEPIEVQSTAETYLEDKITPSEEITSDLGIDDISDISEDSTGMDSIAEGNEEIAEDDDDDSSVPEEIVLETTEAAPASVVSGLSTEEPSFSEDDSDDREEDEPHMQDDLPEIPSNLPETAGTDELAEDLEVLNEVEYENADITNEADYDIRDQLDALDKMIDKSDLLDDEEEENDNHDNNGDEEEEENDADPEDEFDFWQF